KMLYSKSYKIQNVGKLSIAFLRKSDTTLSNGQRLNFSKLEVIPENKLYKSTFGVEHFEVSLIKAAGTELVSKQFVSGALPGINIVRQMNSLNAGGKIIFEQVIIRCQDCPYRKADSLTIEVHSQ